MSEAEFQRQLVTLLKLYGWRVQWTWNSKHSPAGWPDLTVWAPKRGLWLAELKAEKGRLTKLQKDTIASLRAAGQEVYVWRPSDWDEIMRRVKP